MWNWSAICCLNLTEKLVGGAKALGAILKIGQQLPDDEFESIIAAPIIRMFASPDRAIRISLLENMPKFIDHIPNKAVTNQIFPNVVCTCNVNFQGRNLSVNERFH